MKIILLLLILISLCKNLFSQAQQNNFYDDFHSNLERYKGDKNNNNSDEEYNYKEYDQPPNFQKPALVTPKNPQVPFQTPLNLINPNSGSRPATPITGGNEVYNPFTGQFNYQALIDKEKNKQQKQKRTIRERLYHESRFRRFNVIFFQTLPFTAVLSYALVKSMLIDKTMEGTIFIFGFSFLLAGANATQDQIFYSPKKKDLANEDTQVRSSNSFFEKRNYTFYFPVAIKRF